MSGVVLPSFSYSSTASNFGTQSFIDKKLITVTFNGTLQIKDSEVSESTQVNGTLTVENSELNALNVNGSISLDESVIKGAVTVNGTLEATKSRFQNTITAITKRLCLSGSTAVDVLIKNSSDSEEIILSGGTKIAGSITFESGKGKVIIKDSSEVTGEVRGGVVVRE
jgi:hypothetical protein